MIVIRAIDHPTYAYSDANCEGLFVNPSQFASEQALVG